jgi:hypothetical protein
LQVQVQLQLQLLALALVLVQTLVLLLLLLLSLLMQSPKKEGRRDSGHLADLSYFAVVLTLQVWE